MESERKWVSYKLRKPACSEGCFLYTCRRDAARISHCVYRHPTGTRICVVMTGQTRI